MKPEILFELYPDEWNNIETKMLEALGRLDDWAAQTTGGAVVEVFGQSQRHQIATAAAVYGCTELHRYCESQRKTALDATSCADGWWRD